MFSLVPPMINQLHAHPDWEWWPDQAKPKAYVSVSLDQLGKKHLQENLVLAESLSGLAAQAVNAGDFDEMAWIEWGPRESHREWLLQYTKSSQVEYRGSFTPMQLLRRYKDRGLVKGYIIYTPDTSNNPGRKDSAGMDFSLNVATTAAGVLGGVLVTPEMVPEMEALGLPLLLDARGKTERWAFESYKDKLNRRLLFMQSPQNPNARDSAIAQKAMAVYTLQDPLPDVMAWLEPLSTVYGWYAINEGTSVTAVSKAGHILVAADWCMNLPLYASGRDRDQFSRPLSPKPALDDIKAWAGAPAVSYMLSDGDNLQWLLGGFTHNPRYWMNPARGKIPFGWTVCPGDILSQAPMVWEYLKKHTLPRDAFVAHAGYFYPDLLGKNLAPEKRRELLTALARRINGMMKESGCRILTFLCMEVDNEDAREAYAIFAKEMPDVLAVFPIKFAPYEGGDGKVYWLNDGRGGEMPFITARYSIWSEVNRSKRPRAGSPEQVSWSINQDLAARDGNFSEWVIIHAWSGFEQERLFSADERVPNYMGKDSAWGPEAALLSAEKLDPKIRVLNPEELAWLIRWQRNPEATEQLLKP